LTENSKRTNQTPENNRKLQQQRKTKRLGSGKCLMNVPRQLNHLNCIERILNDEISKQTMNSSIKMKKTTKTSEK